MVYIKYVLNELCFYMHKISSKLDSITNQSHTVICIHMLRLFSV